MAQFSEKEKELINSGARDVPMRVLLITNEEDSLFLRQRCADVDLRAEQKELQLLIDRLKMTMHVESGVGIAAPQVGISKNVFIFTRINHPDHPAIAAINPKIINRPEETICFENDGCLSIPNMNGNSLRYAWVDVEYTNEFGELVLERLEGYSRSTGFTGVIFQHEYDHLQGILFTDKLCPLPIEDK